MNAFCSDHVFGTVVLLGPPNAGKSTLLNACLGHKIAIVSPRPQTTRNQITGILTEKEAQIVFLDTPGVHRLRGRMNALLLRSAWAAAHSADVMVVVIDAALYTAKRHLLEKELAPLIQKVAQTQQPVFVAANKTDRIRKKETLLPVLESLSVLWPRAHILPVCAATGQDLDTLLALIKKHLPLSPPAFPEDQLSTVPLRFMAAEIVREKLFVTLRQELPYSTAVEIESWHEEGHIISVNALIWVARKNHKAMVIGRGGSTLKTVGTQARKDIAQLVGSRVHLELWVKVRQNWTEDNSFLHSIGLADGS